MVDETDADSPLPPSASRSAIALLFAPNLGDRPTIMSAELRGELLRLGCIAGGACCKKLIAERCFQGVRAGKQLIDRVALRLGTNSGTQQGVGGRRRIRSRSAWRCR